MHLALPTHQPQVKPEHNDVSKDGDISLFSLSLPPLFSFSVFLLGLDRQCLGWSEVVDKDRGPLPNVFIHNVYW